MRFVYGLAFVSALVSATGCARPWPTVIGAGDTTFIHSGGVRTVALLPLDVTLGMATSIEDPPDVIAASFDGAARTAVTQELGRRGYQVVGTEAEADAVVSLAGFTYAGHDESHAGAIIGAVIAVILIVGIIAMVASKKSGHGHHGGGGGGGGHVHHIRHAPVHVASRGPVFVPDVSVEFVVPPGPVVDNVPADGPSHSLLALRIYEKQSGRVLWSAEADMPADPRNPEDVEKAVARLAQTLPPAR